jgi:hypothetical protein
MSTFLLPTNSFYDCDELRENRRSFCETHLVTKRIRSDTRMKYDKVRYILGMPELGGDTVFDHIELFETSDGYYVGIASPYGSRSDFIRKVFLEDLAGWDVCPGMYCTSEDSFFKKILKTVAPSDILERVTTEFIEANFEPDAEGVLERIDLMQWFDTLPSRKWSRLLHYDSQSPKRSRHVTIFDHIQKRLGPFKSWKQVVRDVPTRLADEHEGSIRCFLTGWRIKTTSGGPVLPATMNVMSA